MVETGMSRRDNGMSPADTAKMQKLPVLIQVYQNAVHVSYRDYGRPVDVGWFDSEVQAIAACAERLLIHSAILPDLRQMPNVEIVFEYEETSARHDATAYVPGIVRRGSKVLKLPWADRKPWLTILPLISELTVIFCAV